MREGQDEGRLDDKITGVEGSWGGSWALCAKGWTPGLRTTLVLVESGLWEGEGVL